MHQRLRLGIAQADVEFEHAGPVGGHHQTGVEEAGEPVASTVGSMMRVQDLLALVGGENAGVAIGAHAAGVGSRVAIEDGFVILSGLERHARLPSQRAMKLTSSPSGTLR